MRRRNISRRLEEALDDTPVVLLNGPRQTGKTTLVSEFARSRYFTLDDSATLAAAAADPVSFVRSGSGSLTVIDEVQKAPGLLPAIKVEVDRNRQPGRFLLTGSANVLTLPKVSESLAGRMEVLTLWPFSQGELDGVVDSLVDRLFSEPFLIDDPPVIERGELDDRLIRGGFPEAQSRPVARRRRAWFRSYITTILQRDIRDLAAIEGITQIPRLLSLLAARCGALLNKSEVSRSTGYAYTTLDRYLALLEAIFLFQPLPAFSTNLNKRLTRAPKTFLCDSGLAAQLTGVTGERLAAEPMLRGPLLETFVMMELRKQVTWAEAEVTLFHFRAGKREVDFVLEDTAGKVVGIEVKASASLGARDFSGLKALAADLGSRFISGVILYTGQQTLPFGEKLWALPISALWQDSALVSTGPGLHL